MFLQVPGVFQLTRRYAAEEIIVRIEIILHGLTVQLHHVSLWIHANTEQSDLFLIKHSPLGKVTVLVDYVHDMVVTGNDLEENNLNGNLAREFEIEDLGDLKYFIGKWKNLNKVYSYPSGNMSLIFNK